ncbi:hypothetical protein PHLCEN_2v7295 [Hermanssonia centrifuga]|uniref:Uncharacterized protein n=1 Tax=Hermanssonia centrifuga TaxID=98765 RepID=A0A2R6NX15_9APHY|nr:hypothetical protein PHLCEN_2v7295 [Hermanssonia centrifuga]
MTTNYPTAPPSYTGPTNKISTATPDEEAAQPLLNSRAGPSAGFGGYYDQPDAGDVPDDFKYDFSGMGPWLFGGLIAMMMTGLVGIFIPFSHTMDLIYAIGGTLLFSGYIVYDTYIINKRLSPDEYIMGAISLYLDFINLFISILRLLNNAQEN